MKIISEQEFADRLDRLVKSRPDLGQFKFVTGPGRSGAIASVYASHALGIPFLPYGSKVGGEVLVIDTVTKSGRTLRKAERRYGGTGVALFDGSSERHVFWYEASAREQGT